MLNDSINLSVYCLKYAESVLPESMFFVGGERDKTMPISFAIYLIRLNDRNILVDAGCDTMPGFDMKNFYSPVSVLKTTGLTSKEITDVVITHAHHDHIEAIRHFDNATVHITDQEYTIGKKFIPDNLQVNKFEREFVISSNVKIIQIGGHSIGSAIVEIDFGGITHVLCGDECYIDKCITEKIPTGAYYNLEKSRAFVEKYSDEKYVVHTCHDFNLKTERII